MLTLPTLGTLRRLEMTNVAWARLISLWRGTQAALHNQATHHSAIPYGNKNTHSLNSQYYNCLTETYKTDIADRLWGLFKSCIHGKNRYQHISTSQSCGLPSRFPMSVSHNRFEAISIFPLIGQFSAFPAKPEIKTINFLLKLSICITVPQSHHHVFGFLSNH